MQDFAALQLNEINAGIHSRRNKIFLLMEEVRRLRIQQRLKVRLYVYRSVLHNTKVVVSVPGCDFGSSPIALALKDLKGLI